MNSTYFLHIVNNINSSININGICVNNYIDNDIKSINIVCKTNNIILTNNPFSTTSLHLLSYTEKINLDDIKESDLIKIIPFKNNHYEIFFNDIPISITNLNTIVTDEYLGKFNIVCSNNINGNILIYENSKLKKQLQTNKIISAEIKQKLDKIIIKCLLEKNKYYISILDTNNLNIIFENCCDSIEEDGYNYKTIICVCDLAKHGIVKAINIENLQEEKYNVYLKNEPVKTTIKEIIPMAFLESIKIENYELARSYLADNFANISNEHLKNYFDKIEEIYFDKYNPNPYSIPYVIKTNNGFENVDFVIENEKILDINK